MNAKAIALCALVFQLAAASLSAADAPKAFQVIKGTHEGKPSSRIKNATGSVDVLVVHLDEAKTWDQADRSCAALSPAGDFKLPDPTNHLILTISGVNPGLQSSVFGGKAIYPLWVRGSNDAETAKHFKGSSNMLVMADGRGMDTELMDLSEFVKALTARRDELPHRTWNEDIIKERLAVEDLLAQVSPGMPVYCVKEAK